MSNELIGVQTSVNNANSLKNHINTNNTDVFLAHLISTGTTKKRYEYWNNTQVEDVEKIVISPEVANQVDYLNSLGSEIKARNILLSREANPTTNNYNVVPANFFEVVRFENTNIAVFNEELKRQIYRAYNRWNSIITHIPFDSELPDRKILILHRFRSLSSNTLGAVGISSNGYASSNDISGDIFKKYVHNGYNYSNQDKYDEYIANPELFYNIQLHEIGHILGIGNVWYKDEAIKDGVTLINEQTDSNGKNHKLYMGPKAREIYNYYSNDGTPLDNKNYINNDYPEVSQCVGIPLEDYASSGTNGKHPEEGTRFNDTGHQISDNNITINDVYYPSFGQEIMTGFFERTKPMPISAITLGFLEDMGYGVDYSKADEYVL
jgi:hypothetical protein